MKIAIYGKTFSEDFCPGSLELFSKLRQYNAHITIYSPFKDFLRHERGIDTSFDDEFYTHEDLGQDINFLISIGGDGTFLEAVTMVRGSGIPIIGINSGRLGFLANIAKGEISQSIDAIMKNQYTLEQRTLIELKSKNNYFGDFRYALNEFAVQKHGSSMITIHTSINKEFLNTYFTDGLIISTPTGSTAYSLSVGGPIVSPSSRNFIISPIASHNLNVRPIVVPDYCEVTLQVDGRDCNYMITLDSRVVKLKVPCEFIIKRADFTLKMLKLSNNNFFNTLRNKLMWGMDKRY